MSVVVDTARLSEGIGSTLYGEISTSGTAESRAEPVASTVPRSSICTRPPVVFGLVFGPIDVRPDRRRHWTVERIVLSPSRTYVWGRLNPPTSPNDVMVRGFSGFVRSKSHVFPA